MTLLIVPERESRALVAQDGRDKRFRDAKFIKAPAIFANNDIKYETNKLRARQYAAVEQKTMTYACAKDTPSADALREQRFQHGSSSALAQMCNPAGTAQLPTL